MRLLRKPAAVLLCCALLLSLASCAAKPAAEVSPPAATQVLAGTHAPAPTPKPSPTATLSPSPSVTPDTAPPPTSTPVPVPDQETELTYPVGEEELTVPALLRTSPFGYSITYDTQHYVCHSYSDSEVFWLSEDNYLSVSLVFDFSVDDVLAGLRLQQNIRMEPTLVAVGAGDYISYTLYFTDVSGLYQQFWVLPFHDIVLLVEQSYDTVSDYAPLYRASQQAMLETLTILP